MVKGRVLDRCGLGLIIDDVGVGERSVVGIKIAIRNNRNNIVVAFDETQV